MTRTTVNTTYNVTVIETVGEETRCNIIRYNHYDEAIMMIDTLTCKANVNTIYLDRVITTTTETRRCFRKVANTTTRKEQVLCY